MIRKYKATDTDSILEIWYAASTLAHPFLADEFVAKTKIDMRELYLPNAETWVYEKEGNVLGFISMLGNEIGGLFVFPHHHSQGIGTQLVNYVRPLHETLEVEVFENNGIGRPFYDKYGFKFMESQVHEPTQQQVLRLKYVG